MKIQPIVGLLFACFWSLSLAAQEKVKTGEASVSDTAPWKLVSVDTKASLRGLHVRSATDIWASGSGGTITHSNDGGKTWRVTIVPGAEELDFRDIHAIDDSTVVAMTSGTPARIYRSTDGGLNWKQVYENRDERVFLDALSFWNDQVGIVMGDPIEGNLFLLETSDGGRTWNPSKQTPRALTGEGGFAASGTNMITTGTQKVLIALGGDLPESSTPTSRILVSDNAGIDWVAATAPMARNTSAGIFSLCFANSNDGVAVGGDYQKPDATTSNYATTHDGGKTWSVPEPLQPPSGFRSCVAVWIDGRDVKFVSVGPNGTDLSADLGEHWQRVSGEGFHAIDFSPDGKQGWASGVDGRIAQWLGIATLGPTK